ncbi:alpha/beta fold hydrolase [Streptomyces sp. 6N223]|uniref:alpha/beta fold hydrolase n=1 Tax=Streptomyces sp. 6N223 TaxID=3457412 RepID=UPI003FD1CAD3
MSTTAEIPQPPGVTHERLDLGDDTVSLLRGGSGDPVLFLHSAGGAGTWMPLHAKLAEGFDVIAPDHPGFAGSGDFPALEDVQDLAFHYADLIAALGLSSVTVVGTSFGGWIAAELAAYRPALVDKLVLVDPIGLYVEGAPIGDLFAMSPQEKMATLVADPSKLAGLFPDDPDVDTVLALARNEASFTRFAWQPFCHDPRLPRMLPRITAPTLVLWGELDALVPVAHGERYAELIPGARLEVLPGVGHAASLECPDELAARISDFVA